MNGWVTRGTGKHAPNYIVNLCFTTVNNYINYINYIKISKSYILKTNNIHIKYLITWITNKNKNVHNFTVKMFWYFFFLKCFTHVAPYWFVGLSIFYRYYRDFNFNCIYGVFLILFNLNMCVLNVSLETFHTGFCQIFRHFLTVNFWVRMTYKRFKYLKNVLTGSS